MDNDEFVERFGTLAKALAKLPNDLYKATKPNATAQNRSDAAIRARSLLKEYESFLPLLSEGRRARVSKRCQSDVENIRTFLGTLEKMG